MTTLTANKRSSTKTGNKKMQNEKTEIAQESQEEAQEKVTQEEMQQPENIQFDQETGEVLEDELDIFAELSQAEDEAITVPTFKPKTDKKFFVKVLSEIKIIPTKDPKKEDGKCVRVLNLEDNSIYDLYLPYVLRATFTDSDRLNNQFINKSFAITQLAKVKGTGGNSYNNFQVTQLNDATAEAVMRKKFGKASKF